METKEQELRNIEQLFQKAESYINQGRLDIGNPGSKCNMLLGMTRSGKSTLLNYLLGKKLIADYVDPTAKGAAGKKLKIKLQNQNQQGQATIGNQIKSETTIPKKYQSKQGSFKQPIFDNPGFGDNRGVAIDISNAILISELLAKGRNFRFILVTDVSNVNGDNIALFIKLIKHVTQLFDISNLLNHTCLVVTKVDPDYQIGDIEADLDKTVKQIEDPEFNKTLIQNIRANNRILMFKKPIQKGPVQNQNAQQITKNILSIEPLLKLNIKKVKVSVSSQTKNTIYQQNMVLSQYINKDICQFLDHLYQLIDVQKITTNQQLIQKQKQFKQFCQNKLVIQPQVNNLQEMLDIVNDVFLQNKIQIQQKLLNSIRSKIEFTGFIKKIVELNTLQADKFKNELSIRITNINGNFVKKLSQFLCEQGKISKAQMEKQMKQQQRLKNEQLQAIKELEEKMQKRIDNNAKQLMGLANDEKKRLLKIQQQKKQIQKLRIQAENKKRQLFSGPKELFSNFVSFFKGFG